LRATVAGDAGRQLSQELEEIFERHCDMIYRTAWALTRSKEDSEDILQTIFLRLLARETPPDLHAAPERYLYRAAFNLALNTLRRRKREVLTDDISIFGDNGATTRVRTAESLDEALHDAISRLDTAVAQILILRYVHNYSLSDIARIMRTTRGTIAVSLFRARARLRKLLAVKEGEGA
jgi:RNA polymerase sigma-70 factor, ECF subfamily